MVGISKRELLQEVLPIFGQFSSSPRPKRHVLIYPSFPCFLSVPILARGRALAGMAQEWQILLARIESERDV